VSTTQPSPRAAVGLGLAVSAMGALIMLLAAGMIPGGDASLDAPRWVVACAGVMFVLLGAALIVGYAVAGGAGPDGDLPAGTPRWVRMTQFLLGLGIVSALAAVTTWVAFGPGPRAFTMTIPFAGRGPGDETVGRAAFGIGAVLMWLFLLVFLVVSVRRLRRASADQRRRP
jgi:hypothetical protein